MSNEKTRVLTRDEVSPSTETGSADGQIVFKCPAGHRIVVPLAFAGKRGKCSKCSEPVEIPNPQSGSQESTGMPMSVAGAPATAPDSGVPATQPGEPSAEEGDWNFISGIDGPGFQQAADVSSTWSVSHMIPPDANPMARLLARLWAERDHGGIVELHLVGGAVILPEEFSPRWSGNSHGVFASQAADGSVTITAVGWDTVQKIVVRQLTAVPGDMFE